MPGQWDPRGGPDRDTRTPRFKLPKGACDAHVHVFGPRERFAFAPEQLARAFDAPKEDLAAMHAVIGAERCVIVHGAKHGNDLSVTLDAMASDAARYRAVAVVSDAITDAQLEALDRAGVRGVRYNIVPHLGGPPDPDAMRRMAERIAGLGWHLVLHMRDDDILTYADLFRSLKAPLLFDHMARIDPAKGGVDQTAFRTLLGFLESGDNWVKIAAVEKISRLPYPFDDVVSMAACLIEAAPDRVIWGTDWPHPDVGPQGPSNDGDLVDLIPAFAPDAAARRKLLVDNPARLYRF